MSATNELLDKVRDVCALRSDAALARKIGIAPSAVSNYRQGTRHPEPEIIEALASAAKESPIAWALRVQAEREEKINPRRAKVWLRWSRQVAGIAAAVALTVGLASPAPAHAAQAGSSARNQGTLSIM